MLLTGVSKVFVSGMRLSIISSLEFVANGVNLLRCCLFLMVSLPDPSTLPHTDGTV